MMVRVMPIAFALAIGLSSIGTAQDFGIMESAEIIQPGNFKLTAYPVLILGENGAGNDWGGVLRGGYGFTDRIDAELALALYDGSTLLGGNIELALLKSAALVGGIDLSARGGAHAVRNDIADAIGIDAAGILSSRLTQNLELVGSLDFGQNFYDEPFTNTNTFHLVPGIEYRVTRNLDVMAELGVGLDENAANYISAGLAWYFR